MEGRREKKEKEKEATIVTNILVLKREKEKALFV